MDKQWFFTEWQRQNRPLFADEIAQLAAHGLLLPTDMTWRVGVPKWMPAASAGFCPPSCIKAGILRPATVPLTSVTEAVAAFRSAWPHFVSECRSVLGSELHYQAMLYFCLRSHGLIPLRQLGMNVKMMVRDPITEAFIEWTEKRSEGYQVGFEPVPDVVIFSSKIEGDWRRRRCLHADLALSSHVHILAEFELKASEWKDGRITPGKVIHDIVKLASHREEVACMRKGLSLPVIQPYQAVVIVDTAPEPRELMKEKAITLVMKEAEKEARGLFLHIIRQAHHPSIVTLNNWRGKAGNAGHGGQALRRRSSAKARSSRPNSYSPASWSATSGGHSSTSISQRRRSAATIVLPLW